MSFLSNATFQKFSTWLALKMWGDLTFIKRCAVPISLSSQACKKRSLDSTFPQQYALQIVSHIEEQMLSAAYVASTTYQLSLHWGIEYTSHHEVCRGKMPGLGVSSFSKNLYSVRHKNNWSVDWSHIAYRTICKNKIVIYITFRSIRLCYMII